MRNININNNIHTHHILLLSIIIAALAVVGKAQTMSSPLTYGVYECPEYNGVAPACADTRVAGCVEYKNGAREYRTDGNECVFCSLPGQSVASFTRGSDCSDLQSPTPTPTPTPRPRPRPTPNPTPFPRFNNRNWFTNNNNNNNNNGNRFWFTNNNNNNNNNNNFAPQKCPDYTFVTPACADTQEAGCVGYKNGTYEYRTDGNACFFCSLPGRPVDSFTPGQRCPTSQTRRTPTFTSGGGRTVVVRRGGVSTGGVFRGGVFRGTKH